jgi:cystathionine gamma-synthase
MLFPTPKISQRARDFLANLSPSIPSRTVEFVICPGANSLPSARAAVTAIDCIELQILLFNKDHFPFAKQFWQHTGDGISSRMAERALAFMGETPAGDAGLGEEGPGVGAAAAALTQPASRGYSRNRHYGRATTRGAAPGHAAPAAAAAAAPKPGVAVPEDVAAADLSTYLEERYGRNLPLFSAPLAKQALKRRIAGGVLPSDEEFGASQADISRGVTENDVYLFPGGMSAIWHAHNIVRLARTATGAAEGKSVCFGFPYTDTLKILQKWGPGCHFYGNGTDAELDELEALLDAQDKGTPILSLFCEFPSNPLLRCPDLPRLRKLADKHGFVIVVDETIGNFINVDVMPYADIVVSSLTKIFSGDSNVMGGSLVLNPATPQYAALKAAMDADYEDTYYPEDVVYMERNSRDYRSRIKRVNDNAFDVTEFLYSRSLEDTSTPAEGKALKRLYYPRWETPGHFAACQRQPPTGKGGFGGLFSVTFTSTAAAIAFYDTLLCAKGPSLGTSFTLASPYAILAHYAELDWAAGYGVESDLVRISIGQEAAETLKAWFENSVKAAEEAVAKEQLEQQAKARDA